MEIRILWCKIHVILKTLLTRLHNHGFLLKYSAHISRNWFCGNISDTDGGDQIALTTISFETLFMKTSSENSRYFLMHFHTNTRTFKRFISAQKTPADFWWWILLLISKIWRISEEGYCSCMHLVLELCAVYDMDFVERTDTYSSIDHRINIMIIKIYIAWSIWSKNNNTEQHETVWQESISLRRQCFLSRFAY